MRGLRLLMLSDVDWGIQYAWVVHPDSARLLSTDALGPFRTDDKGRVAALGRAQLSFDAPTQINWAPDGSSLALVGFNEGDWSTILQVPIGSQLASQIKLRSLIQFSEDCFIALAQPSSWARSRVMKVRLSLEDNPWRSDSLPCRVPADSVAEVVVDFDRAAASRIR